MTFTNLAAQEMRHRVEEDIDNLARQVHIRTFHGLSAWMLRRDADHIGLVRDFVIYDEEDCKPILASSIKKTGRRCWSCWRIMS